MSEVNTEEIFEDYNFDQEIVDSIAAEDESLGETESPLQQTFDDYTPEENENVISEIPPANFDNIMKVLKVLTKDGSTSSILIRNSQIKQETGSNLIEADLSKDLNQNINLDIVDSKYVRLFEQFRSGKVFIIDDSENSRFIITNGEIRLFLPKQDQNVEQSVENYDLEKAQLICQKNIDKTTRNKIKNLSKNAGYVEYLIKENDLKGIHIPDIAVYIFKENLKEPGISKLDETNADISLRSNSFLPIEAENYEMFLAKLDDKHINVVNCEIGNIAIRITESCDLTTGGNLLI